MKKILVVDDDVGILDAMKYTLEDAGYMVSTIADGNVVLQMKKREADVLLLDIWMSGTNGADICIRLKKQETTKNMPIILVSANNNTEKIAKECGADDFLSKPFEISDLLDKVAKYSE